MIRKILLSTFSVLTLIALTGCLRTTVNLTPDDGVVNYVQRHSFFLFGLFPEQRQVNASEMCEDGRVTKLETKTTFMDGFLSGITIGIYYPKTLVGWCKLSD